MELYFYVDGFAFTFFSEQDIVFLPSVGLFRLILYNITILNNTGAYIFVHLSLIASLFFFFLSLG